jgi:hypothetical protein
LRIVIEKNKKKGQIECPSCKKLTGTKPKKLLKYGKNTLKLNKKQRNRGDLVAKTKSPLLC